MRQVLKPILLIVSWRQFARQYFNRSASWLYHKIDGIDPITDEERLKFKQSLLSLSDEIREVAGKI